MTRKERPGAAQAALREKNEGSTLFDNLEGDDASTEDEGSEDPDVDTSEFDGAAADAGAQEAPPVASFGTVKLSGLTLGKAPRKKPARKERPLRFPIDTLDVGESLLLPASAKDEMHRCILTLQQRFAEPTDQTVTRAGKTAKVYVYKRKFGLFPLTAEQFEGLDGKALVALFPTAKTKPVVGDVWAVLRTV